MTHKEHLLKLLEKVPETELQDLREWLCHMTALIGCEDTPTRPTPPSGPTIIGPVPDVIIGGMMENDAFHFRIDAEGGQKASVPVILDTGAFEMLVTGDKADALALPNKGPIEIAGVTGSSEAYLSEVTISVPGLNNSVRVYNLSCVVDPSATSNLFGLRFFIDRQLWLTLDTKTATLRWGQS